MSNETTVLKSRLDRLFGETYSEMREQGFSDTVNQFISNASMQGEFDEQGYLEIYSAVVFNKDTQFTQGEFTDVSVVLFPEAHMCIHVTMLEDDIENWDSNKQSKLQDVFADAAEVIKVMHRKCETEGIKLTVSPEPVQGMFLELLDSDWLTQFKADLSPITDIWMRHQDAHFVNLKEPCCLLSVTITDAPNGESYLKQFVANPDEDLEGHTLIERAVYQLSQTEEGQAMIENEEFDWQFALNVIESDYPQFYSNQGLVPINKALEQTDGNLRISMVAEINVSHDNDILNWITPVDQGDDDPLTNQREMSQSANLG